MWRQFLNEMSTTDSRVFVIAEHADEMETEALRTLEGVTAADPNGGLGANLILLGQPELNDRLKLPALASLNQRVRLRQRLEPFSVEELEAYLKHRVTIAGGSFDSVFARDAIGALHQYSGGLPRVVNNLCETALTLAATGAEQRVTQQLVMRVAIGLYGIESAADTRRRANRAIGYIGTDDTRLRLSRLRQRASASRLATAVAPNVAAASAAQPGTRQASPRTAPEFPVLTDAIETPSERKPQAIARTEPKQPAQPARREAPPAAPAQAPAKAASAAPAHSPAPPSRPAAAPVAAAKAPPAQPPPKAHEPARPPAAAVASAQGAAPRLPATKAMQEPDEAEVLHQTQTMRALASAKSIDDISNSMAETLFGDADLDMLSAALASAGWSDDSEEARTSCSTSSRLRPSISRPRWRRRQASSSPSARSPSLLELVDDSPTGKNRARKSRASADHLRG